MNSSIRMAATGVLALSGAAVGQTDQFYVTDGDANRAVRMQGGAINLTFQLTDNQYPLAVGSTIKIYGTYDGNTGAEYDLDGNPTGVTYPFVGGGGQFLDGATDGGSRNWACSFNDAGIWEFDQDWGGPSLAFTVPSLPEGVTYDPTQDLLYVARSQAAGAAENVVEAYRPDGTFLSSFVYSNDINNRLGGLAWEPSSDTLWGIYNGQNTVVQFDKSGKLLQTFQVNGLASNNWGGEFSVRIPGPGSAALLGLSAVMAGRRRR